VLTIKACGFFHRLFDEREAHMKKLINLGMTRYIMK
jgi:hypothetical protein